MLLLGILVVMGMGVRPALKRINAIATGPRGREISNSAKTPLPAPEPPPPPDPQHQRAQEIFEQVTGQVKKQPVQTSRLLQSWIHSD